jgi:hypothetical protein
MSTFAGVAAKECVHTKNNEQILKMTIVLI